MTKAEGLGIGRIFSEFCAINANEIVVTFNKEVTASALNTDNYALTINDRRYVGTPADGSANEIDANEVIAENSDATRVLTWLDSKHKAVVFKLADTDKVDAGAKYGAGGNRIKLDNGDKYGIDVRDGVKSVDGDKVKYADTQKVFQDYDAPKLVGIRVNGDSKLVVEFDEPVIARNEGDNEDFKVTVDGQKVDMTASIDALDYTVVSDVALPSDLLEKGVHNVNIYNARDIVENNGQGGNKVALLKGSYEIKEVEGEEPVVQQVVPLDFNSFAIIFDQAVKNDFKVKVTHNNTEFYNDSTVQYVGKTPIIPGDNKSYHHAVINLPYTAVSPNGGVTMLYDNDHLSKTTNINLEVADYQSASTSKLYGKTYKKTNVTLTRDARVLEFKGTNVLDDTDTLKAKLNIAGLKEGQNLINKVRVYDKDGIARTVLAANLDGVGESLEITINDGVGSALAADDLKELAPFKVELREGAVLLDSDSIDVASVGSNGKKYIAPTGNSNDEADMWGQLLDETAYDKTLIAYTNQLKNKIIETTVEATTPEDDAYKAVEAVDNVNVTANVITIEYKEKMGKGVTTLSNYTLDDDAMPAGTELDLDGNGKKVTITLPEESIAKTGLKQVVISKNVFTAKGSYVVGNLSTKEVYRSQLETFTDNTNPLLESAKFVLADADDKTTDTIELKFNEKVVGQAHIANFVVIAQNYPQIPTSHLNPATQWHQ